MYLQYSTDITLNIDQDPLSPTIKKVLSVFLRILLYLAAFECNITPDWLNRNLIG